MVKNISDISDVQVKFSISFDYTQNIKDAIEEGYLESMEEVKRYLLETLEEDIKDYLIESSTIKNCVKISIK